jgi:arylsulfatase
MDTGDNRVLWWSHKGNHAVRNGNWKLVKTNEGNWELYNISEDRAETANLVDQYPEKVKELEKQWEAQVEQIRQVKKLK